MNGPGGPGLAAQVAGREWYHTLELAPGVVTPGWFDTRALADRLPWPDLGGRRCLDVGTFDGFWAFEMERRGAAEVVAVDVPDPADWDWPAGSDAAVREALARRRSATGPDGEDGFAIAARALGSAVERVPCSVYDLHPSRVGTFGCVYVGSLLLHLRDPVGALGAVRGVCDPGADLLVVDAVDLGRSLWRRPLATIDAVGRPWWWKPNRAALARMAVAAGFEPVGPPRLRLIPPGAGQPRAPVSLAALRHREGRASLLRSRLGDPHAVVRARAR